MPLVIPLFIPHRGCPHQCLFCNQNSITGTREGAVPEAEDISRTLRTWLARSPGRSEVQAAFFGGSFTCLPMDEQERLLATVRPFIESGEVGQIRLSTRPDCITADICRFLAAHRVGIVELGVQSFDDLVLKTARRGHTAEDCRRAIVLLKEAGMQVGVQLMPGLPAENTCSFLAGIRETIRFAPAFVRLYPAVVLRHSELGRQWQQGIYRPLSLNQAVALTAMAKKMFDAAVIPVVRMGLQPSVELEKEVLAGPYHPAFGECVISRLWFKEIRGQIALLEEGRHLTMYAARQDQSAIIGSRKINIRRLESLGYAGRFTLQVELHRERGSREYVVS